MKGGNINCISNDPESKLLNSTQSQTRGIGRAAAAIGFWTPRRTEPMTTFLGMVSHTFGTAQVWIQDLQNGQGDYTSRPQKSWVELCNVRTARAQYRSSTGHLAWCGSPGPSRASSSSADDCASAGLASSSPLLLVDTVSI